MDLAGKLLVALPILVEDSFRRTVILVLSHGEGGALGVIINRPSDLPLWDALPQWHERAAAPAVVFHGGPVEPGMAIALGDDGDRARTVDLDGDPTRLAPAALRVFAGHAGWAPDQLEAEIDAGAWAVVDSEPGDGFRADAAQLWQLVLSRQRGPLRRLAMLPEDVRVN